MTIGTLYNNLKALDIEKVAVESIELTSDWRVDLNVEQLQNGLRSDGSEILPSYTDFTIMMKKLKGQPFNHVTLRDTGAFHAGVFSKVQELSIETDSVDTKSEKLKRKYETSKGKLFGLNKDSKEEYIEDTLQPVFSGKIEKITGLKFKV